MFNRAQAVYIGQDLLDNGWLECAYDSEPVFLDEYMLYQPSKVSNPIPCESILLCQV